GSGERVRHGRGHRLRGPEENRAVRQRKGAPVDREPAVGGAGGGRTELGGTETKDAQDRVAVVAVVVLVATRVERAAGRLRRRRGLGLEEGDHVARGLDRRKAERRLLEAHDRSSDRRWNGRQVAVARAPERLLLARLAIAERDDRVELV